MNKRTTQRRKKAIEEVNFLCIFFLLYIFSFIFFLVTHCNRNMTQKKTDNKIHSVLLKVFNIYQILTKPLA